MKRSITYMAIVFSVLLLALRKPALAQIGGPGWTALTTAGPAVTTDPYNFNFPFVAWKGHSNNRIWYTAGDSQKQAVVPNFLSTKAPAAATIGGTVYLAARGQSTAPTDNIYYTTWNGDSFPASGTMVCAGATCPLSAGSPALAANDSTSTLYLAWTTSSDTIQYATYNGSSWQILGSVSGASTASKPALAVYNGTLFLAWVEGGDVYTSDNTSPLCATCWTSPLQVPGAETTAAPALGVSTVPNHSGLYIAWTAGNTEAGYAPNFAIWGESAWIPWNPPIPVPPGPVANLSPALVSLGAYVDCEPIESFSFNVAYTLDGSDNGEIDFSMLSNEVKKDPGCKQ
jgi:hypothetical protein